MTGSLYKQSKKVWMCWPDGLCALPIANGLRRRSALDVRKRHATDDCSRNKNPNRAHGAIRTDDAIDRETVEAMKLRGVSTTAGAAILIQETNASPPRSAQTVAIAAWNKSTLDP
jgi:hypothetical protein